MINNLRFLCFIIFSVVVLKNASACQKIEYQELKDMSTKELLRKGDSYMFDMKISDIDFRNNKKLDALGNSRAGPQAIVDGVKNARCKEEVDRIVSLLRKRKDLKKSISSSSMENMEFIKHFNLYK